MNVVKYEKKDLFSLIDFNINAFLERDQIEESIKYRFFNNPFSNGAENEIILAKDEKGNIVGQLLIMPSEFLFHNKKYSAFWGMDYFVKSDNRNSFAGFALASKAIGFKYHFGVGFTSLSSKIFQLLKEKNIAYFSMYIRPNIIYSAYRFLFNKANLCNDCTKFPAQILIEDGVFYRVYNPEEILSKTGSWNQGIVEFIRNEDFIRWRFLYYPNKYAIYKLSKTLNNSTDAPVYFVVRPIIWKKMNSLLVVDYRYDLANTDSWGKIHLALLKLSRKLKLASTILGCSLPASEKKIRKNLFFRFGKKLEILTNFVEKKEVFDFQNAKVFVTMADSDSDFYYGNHKWQ
jgi:hypothetical protein